MDWPILVDSLNLLQVAAVPYTLLIDEKGMIRFINPSQDEFEHFIHAEFRGNHSQVRDSTPSSYAPDLETLKQAAVKQDNASSWGDYAESLFLWGGDVRLKECVTAFENALSKAPKDGWLHFRLGVAYRRLFDLGSTDLKPFQKAIERWQKALDIDPNQYIWRRRIQQYGPRLDKPYSFYDWVNQARKDIKDRGEQPFQLRVEPGGAEFAYPSQERIDSVETPSSEPDPKARVFRDTKPAIQLESTVVSSTYSDKKAVRIHLRFQPNPIFAFHWNNEAEPLSVWVNPASGWKMASPLVQIPNPPAVTDKAPRIIEFELIQVQDAPASEISGYALYNICEEINGTCLFRRQDFSVPINNR